MKLLANNLNYTMTMPGLAEWFEQVGELNYFTQFLNANGSFNGTCRFEYKHTHSAHKALTLLHKQYLNGRAVLIHQYDPNRANHSKLRNKITFKKRKMFLNQIFLGIEWKQISNADSIETMDSPNFSGELINLISSNVSNNINNLINLLEERKKDGQTAKPSKNLEENLEHISKNCHFTEYETKSLIKKKLENNDSDIQTEEETYKLSLICPLSRKRIEKPSRGINCTHLECFDLETYVQLGFKSFKWNCPVCKKYTSMTDLKLDKFLLNIIKESSKDNIEILKDFNWKHVEQSKIENKSTNVVINLCDLTKISDSTIILDDDDDEDDEKNFYCLNDTDNQVNKLKNDFTSLNFNTENNLIICDKNDGTDKQPMILPRLNDFITQTNLEINNAIKDLGNRNIEKSSTNQDLTEQPPFLNEKASTENSNKVSEENATCPTCNRTFKGIRGLKSHLSSKTNTCIKIFK